MTRIIVASVSTWVRTIRFALAASLLPAGVGGQDDSIFSPADAAARANESVNAVPDGITLRRRLVTVDIDRLAQARDAVGQGVAPSAALRLNLFADTVFTGIVERTSPTLSGYVLSGRIEGVDPGTMTVVVNGTVVAGTIRTPRAVYRIRSEGGGVHVVSQIDESRLPPGAEPLRPPPADVARTADAIDIPRNTESAIDVAVFHTPAARQAEGGSAGIQAVIDLMVAETNRAYADSGVQQRLMLVATEETEYTESGFPGVDLFRLKFPADGHMDEVHTIRNTRRADLVHLIAAWNIAETHTCGIAFRMDEVSPGFSAFAFGTSHHNCGGRTFAHELGHNMGLAHDRYVECDGARCFGGAYPYGYGYVNQRAVEAGAPESARWRTIMAYNRQCINEGGFYCERRLRFSNPGQTYAGDPLGIPGDLASGSLTGPSDAVRALNDARGTVESFRSDAHADSLDLVVGLTTVNDTGTAPGRMLTLSARVVNHGAAPAPGTSVAFYRLEPAGDGASVRLGSATVESLASGGAGVTRLEVTAPSSQGVHNYVAYATPVAGELDAANNWSTWLRVPVIVPSCMTLLSTAAGIATRSGSWDGSCPSAYYTRGEYARYYRFALSAPAPVTIDLTSPAADTFLALRTDVELVAVDNDGGTDTNSRIDRTLDAGTYTIEATTYLGEVTGPFTLTLRAVGGSITFTDDPLRPGVTPVRAVHFSELRARIDDLRLAHGLNRFPWTDPTLTTGLTPVSSVHVTELRTALLEAYAVADRTPGFSTEPVEPGWNISAWHVNELRRAVEALR